MTANPEGRVTLTCEQAHTLAMAALTGLGYPTDEALLITHHVMDAALCGYEYSGLAKIVNLAQIRAQRPSVGPMRLLQETSVSALYDGCHHNGMITIDRATDVAIVKAQDHGFGIVGVHRTWMSGRSAYFVERIARAGLVGLHTLGSTPLVAPPGAAVAAIGTNPIAFGFPTLGDPLVIDMGFSTLMFTDLRLRARLGQPLPEGCAIDAQGLPTQDPVAALAGAVLCFGGYKGFGLALAMQALAGLAGSDQDPDNAGYLILAIRPDLLVPLERYRQGVNDLIQRIKSTPRQIGVDEIRIPSERSMRSRARLKQEGIVIDALIFNHLQDMARQGRA